jgi:Protein of unknown function (Hypoth_ymh)
VDYAAALTAFNEYIAMIDARDADHNVASRNARDVQLVERLTLVRMIGQKIYPALRFSEGVRADRWTRIREDLVRVRGWILDMERAAVILGPTGPQLAATGLHPWVWGPAVSSWDAGNYRFAVHAAATNVDEQLRLKLGRLELSGKQLVEQAFSLDDASEDRPRLRFTDMDPARVDDWNSAHDGARSFGIGCTLAIRNVATHGTEEMPEQETLEQLAALSVFARMVAAAQRVESTVP